MLPVNVFHTVWSEAGFPGQTNGVMEPMSVTFGSAMSRSRRRRCPFPAESASPAVRSGSCFQTGEDSSPIALSPAGGGRRLFHPAVSALSLPHRQRGTRGPVPPPFRRRNGSHPRTFFIISRLPDNMELITPPSWTARVRMRPSRRPDLDPGQRNDRLHLRPSPSRNGRSSSASFASSRSESPVIRKTEPWASKLRILLTGSYSAVVTSASSCGCHPMVIKRRRSRSHLQTPGTRSGHLADGRRA